MIESSTQTESDIETTESRKQNLTLARRVLELGLEKGQTRDIFHSINRNHMVRRHERICPAYIDRGFISTSQIFQEINKAKVETNCFLFFARESGEREYNCNFDLASQHAIH